MNLIVLQEFFESYSIGSIILAVAIGLINFLLGKIFGEKIKGALLFIPFILGVALNYLYKLIFVGNATLDGATLSAGVVSGSLSFALKGLLSNLIKGKKLPDGKRAVIITGLIEGYVKSDCIDLVVSLIEEVFVSVDGDKNVQQSEVISKIALHIKSNSDDCEKTDYVALATLIFASVKQTENSI